MPCGNGAVLVGMSERTLASGDHAGGQGPVRPRRRRARASWRACRACGRPCTSTRSSRSPTATWSRRSPRSSTASRRSRCAPTTPATASRSRSRTTPFVDVVADALGLPALRVIETGGDVYASQRQQWDSGNNLVAVEPGVVFAYDRNTTTNALLRGRGHRGHPDRRRRAGPGPRRWALHDLPDHPRRGGVLMTPDRRAPCWLATCSPWASVPPRRLRLERRRRQPHRHRRPPVDHAPTSRPVSGCSTATTAR